MIYKPLVSKFSIKFISVRLRSLSQSICKTSGKDDFRSMDNNFQALKIQSYDANKTVNNGYDSESSRSFTYFLLGGARMIFASAARLSLIKLLASMSASKEVLALASTEIDISTIPSGKTLTVKWRGKPVFVKRRTDQEIDQAQSVSIANLPDPQSDADRVKDPEWLVVVGVCSHLGCVPISGAGDYGGWYCPCHGSHYDTSGRVRKGPAPNNLEVPPYKILPNKKLILG